MSESYTMLIDKDLLNQCMSLRKSTGLTVMLKNNIEVRGIFYLFTGRALFVKDGKRMIVIPMKHVVDIKKN